MDANWATSLDYKTSTACTRLEFYCRDPGLGARNIRVNVPFLNAVSELGSRNRAWAGSGAESTTPAPHRAKRG